MATVPLPLVYSTSQRRYKDDVPQFNTELLATVHSPLDVLFQHKTTVSKCLAPLNCLKVS